MNNPKMLVDRTALKMSRNRAIDSGGYFLHDLPYQRLKTDLVILIEIFSQLLL